MVFPFGVSVSDFVYGIKLVKKAIDATSETRGARADFVDLSRSLLSLDRALNSVLALKLNSDAQQLTLKETVDDCRKCFTAFLVDIAKFQVLKDEYATKGRLLTNFKKIEWAVCKKNDVKKFREQVESHIAAVEMLLLTFQMEMQITVKAATKEIATVSKKVESKVDKCLEVQSKARAESMVAAEIQQRDMSVVTHTVRSTSAAVRSQNSALIGVQRQLRRGLSSREQRDMFQMLQRSLRESEQIRDHTQEFKVHNEALERHVLDIKATICVQRDLPPQVLFQQPVVVFDIMGNAFPFHLETITSVDMLNTVMLPHIEGSLPGFGFGKDEIVFVTLAGVLDIERPQITGLDHIYQPGDHEVLIVMTISDKRTTTSETCTHCEQPIIDVTDWDDGEGKVQRCSKCCLTWFLFGVASDEILETDPAEDDSSGDRLYDSMVDEIEEMRQTGTILNMAPAAWTENLCNMSGIWLREYMLDVGHPFASAVYRRVA